MPIYLRQSTASQEVPLGYFLDSTDGDTAETGLTIANTDIQIWKAGATTLANKNSGGATHISNGVYYAVLDATDTDTLGSLVIFVKVAGALAVRLECVVLAPNVYDSLIAGSDLLATDAREISSSSGAADAVEANIGNLDAAVSNTATASALSTVDGNVDLILEDTSTTIPDQISGLNDLDSTQVQTAAAAALTAYDPPTYTEMEARTLATADYATAASQTTILNRIGAFTGTGVNTVLGFLRAMLRSDLSAPSDVGGTYDPATDSTEALRNRGDSAWITATGFSTHSAADVADAVWDEAAASHVGAGSFGAEVQTHALSSEVGVISTAIGNLNDLSAAEVNEQVDLALADYDAPTKAELDALEAHGDSTWATATGFSTHNAGDVADAVWDETLSAHLGAGSAGAALNGAGSAGDPWTTSLPGAYGAGTAGNILGNRLDAAVSSRSSHSAADVWSVGSRTLTSFGTLIADIWSHATRVLTSGANIVLAKGTGVTGFNDMSAAQVNAEVDTALADYDAPTNAEMEARTLVAGSYATAASVAAVQADTDNIQTRLPAALVGGRMDANTSAINGSATAAILLALSAGTMVNGSAVAGTLSTTQATTNLTSATNDAYNGRVLYWTSGNLAGQATEISDYDGTSKLLTFVAVTGAPGVGDTFIIV